MDWLDPASFAAVVADATRAPSMHNSQPWRFRQRNGAIEVLADLDRRLPVADASGWATRLGCGAALFNLRLALAARGTPAVVTLLPDRTDSPLLAQLTPDTPRPATPAERELHRAIPHRHTNRTPFWARAVPLDVRADLIAAARAENAWLDLLLGPAAVEATAELVHAADTLLHRDPAYQTELASWTRPHGDATDGVPASAGGPAPSPDELLPRRDFGGRPHTGGHHDYERDPLLAVLSGAGDWPADQLQVGQALQRVLLTATRLGLASSMFSQPIEVASVREQLRLALGRHAAPQMLLRFGYAPAAPQSSRRPAAEVMAG